ncbi:Fibulin-5 [Nibea albiflora]|uniref:Fibulin-5 n=1 Tax=Nibea albiflora TaxID=240163 RepID=A0ACB7FFD3_NIBAL|nr:Fibulin-5 [Nibea albiflora]
MLAALVFILLCIQPGHGQTCTEGFAYDRRARQCIDVDECRTLPDACRGDMRCVNQNGGYLCIPRALYSQPFRPDTSLAEPVYPDTSVGFSDTFVPGPRSVEPSYPRVRTTAQCVLGYTLAEDGTCNDLSCSPSVRILTSLFEAHFKLEGRRPVMESAHNLVWVNYTVRVPKMKSCVAKSVPELSPENRHVSVGANDIDECETNSHHCNPTQVCINTAGGYTCSCTEGFWLIGGQCQDVDECDDEPCTHGCLNTYGSFMCNCVEGFELAADGTSCIDLDECSFSEFLCQHRCVNTPGSFSCICPPGYYVYEDGRSCEDLNECDTGNNTCTTAQVCFNFQGGYTCLDPLQCHSPYIEVSDNQCMCSAENPACRDKPFTILYRHMDLSSGRSVPADIFQMQATTRYPGAFYIFQIKSGNDGREFYMRQTSNVSATLVLSRPIKGPREVVLDLEMVTVNNVINFRGSSIIRLTIFVSEHPF